MITHIRKTSREAFKKMKEDGLLTGLRERVYGTIFSDGPLTQREVYEQIKFKEYGNPPREYSIRPRFSELMEMKAIEEVGIRPCKYAKTNAIIYDVTGLVGVPLKDKPKKRMVDIDAFIKQMHGDLSHLIGFASWQIIRDYVEQYKS